MIEKLEKLGLSKGESRVYEALLKLEETTVGPIVKSSGVVYSKIYDVLQRLIQKGLASYIIKEKTRYYKAASPLALKDYLKKKEEEIETSKKELDELLPLLENLHKEENEDTQIFFGYKGILAAYETILKTEKEKGIVKFFYSGGEFNEQVKEFYIDKPQFHGLLKKFHKEKKIEWHALGTKEDTIDPKVKYMKLKIVNYPLPGNIDISTEHILLTSWSKKPMGILIKSKQIAKTFNNYFDAIWNNTK